MKNFALILILSFAFTAQLSFAQNPSAGGVSPSNSSGTTQFTQNPPSEASLNVNQKTTRVVTVADVNVGDISVQEKADGLSGSFTLQGKLGQQNNIVYGIIVTDAKNNVLDAKVLSESISVQEGETKSLNFSYTYPSSLSGKVQILLKVETLEGLPLGTQVLAEKELSSTQKSNLTCVSKGEITEVTCTSQVDGLVTIEYRTNSFFGQLIKEETKEVKRGVSFGMNSELAPGVYKALVRSAASQDFAVAHLVVPGAFGKIQNIAIFNSQDKEEGVLSGVVTARLSQVKGTTSVEAKLFSSTNALCGEQVVILEAGIAEFSFLTPLCQSGTVQVSLRSSDGTTLDTLSQPFSAEKFAQITTDHASTSTAPSVTPPVDIQSDSSWLKWLPLVILVLLLLAYLYWSMTKNKTSTTTTTTLSALAFICVFGASLALVQPAYALTLWGSTYGPRGCGACEIATSVWTTVSTNKASYVPGEAMVVTASHDISGDVGAWPTTYTVVSIGFPTPPGHPSTFDFDLAETGGSFAYAYESIPTPNLPVTTAPQTLDLTVPNNMSPGNHYLSQRLVSQHEDSQGTISYDVHVDRLWFTVSALTFPVAGSCADLAVPLVLNCMADETTFVDCAPDQRSYFQSSPTFRSCGGGGWSDTQTWGQCRPDASCTVTTGTITVTTNNSSASWSIDGPGAADYNGSGLSGATYNNAPAGSYTITWGVVNGQVAPSPSTFTLNAGGTLTFPAGNYSPAPSVNLNFI